MTKLIREEGSCISEGTAQLQLIPLLVQLLSFSFLHMAKIAFRSFILKPNDCELWFYFLRKASVRLLTLDVVAQLSQSALPLRRINVHLFCIDFSFTSIELRFYSMR